LDQRQQAAATTTAPTVAQASADAASIDDSTRLSAPDDSVASRDSYRYWEWFCPDYTPPQVERRKVSPSVSREHSGSGTQKTKIGSSYGGAGGGGRSPRGGGGGGGGGSHARAAASGVPTP